MFLSWIGKEITGELLDGELIERLIAVDGIDDPVAVAPGMGADAVLFVAITIGVTGEVEPMSAPAFSEMGRGEEFVYEEAGFAEANLPSR